MRLLATVTEPKSIARYLRSLGEPTDALAHAPSVRRSQIIAALVIATAALAIVAWFTGRGAAVYVRHRGAAARRTARGG